MQAFLLLVCLVGLGAAAPVDLQAKYPFSSVLFNQQGQYYGLHWNFTRSSESIYFAVNVSTTGWVGFGLSPNGQMVGSDVVIGWVSNTGESYFHDRFAIGRFLPPIDTVSQDWFLTNSEEANGYTVLEFSRNFTSCDPQDLDITPSTARVVWSFSVSDPTSPSGAGANQHNHRGAESINLIGGTTVEDTSTEFLDIRVSNVTIPSASTTYWCESFRLPPQLINTTHYITRISPVLTPHPRSFVHHVLVYICSRPLAPQDVGQSTVCSDLNETVNFCRQGLLVGAWAVGGEDFVYPENIAYAVGGVGQEQFVVIETHYDNPGNIADTVDNSGLRFYYTTEARAQNAGILFLGHGVTPTMLVPPRTSNFTIAGICTAACTNEFIPEEGIRIFAGLLHTHLVGRAITIQHFRWNTECNVLEELEPIDQNLNYDFNFQQFTFYPREHIVLPGDILVLKCEYDTSSNSQFVVGGESTEEEMCLTFPVFYPRATDGSSLVNCASVPDVMESFNDFIGYLSSVDPAAAQAFIQGNLSQVNSLDWAGNPLLARSLQDSVLRSDAIGYCANEDGTFRAAAATVPEPTCSYQAPNRCSNEQPLACCAETPATTEIPTTTETPETPAAATRLEISIGVGSFLLLLSMGNIL